MNALKKAHLIWSAIAPVVFGFIWLVAGSPAAASTILLSNLEQGNSAGSPTFISATVWNAIPFDTGNEPSLFRSVITDVRNPHLGSSFWMILYSDNNGVPGTPVQNGLLSGNASPEGRSTFSAKGGVPLAPNTRYWVVGMTDEPGTSGQGYGLYSTYSWDFSGYPGWVLPHYQAFTTDAGRNWVSTETAQIPRPFYVEIAGTVLPGAGPAVAIADAAGTNAFNFALRLSRTSTVPVTVDWNVAANWAGANMLSPSAGSVTFAPGTTNQSLAISLNGSSGSNQTFRVRLSNPTNGVLANIEAIGVITNNLAMPEVLVLSGSVDEGNINSPCLLALVELGAPSATPVSVDFATLGITAIAGQDFVATNGSITLGGDGPSFRWIPVRVLPNLLSELPKTLTLQLSGSTNPISATLGLLTILNDDGLPGQVDHFSVVMGGVAKGGIPCPVTISALDEDGQMVTNFSERVFLMAGYSNSPPQHFGFEEGDFSQWSPLYGSSQPGPYEMRQWDTTQPGVTNFAFRTSANIGADGIVRNIFLDGGQTYYVSASFAQYVEGPNNGSTTSKLLIDNNPILTVNFGNQNSGVAVRTNVMASYFSSFPIQRFFTFSFERGFFEAGYVGAFVDDLVISPVPVKSVWSGRFTNGTWSGAMTFPSQFNNLVLFAEDLEGHRGASQPFNVLPTPNLALGATLAAGAARAGEPLTFTVTTTNIGQATAMGVVISNGFSPGILVASVTSTLGSCTNFGSNVLCNVGSLAVGQKVTLTIVARASSTNQMGFRAEVAALEADPDPANDFKTIAFSVGLPFLRSASVAVNGAPGGTNLVFPVYLGGPYEYPVSVDFRTWAGLNPPPSDFVQTNGTLVFAPGVSNLSVRVAVLDNHAYAGVQGCDLILENPVNAIFGNGSYFDGTIIDNDPPPSLAISDVSLVEGDAGETEALFTVQLTGPTLLPATVQYATANGTALSGSDYFPTNGTLSIPAGAASGSIRVRVRGNAVNESTETFFVNLTSPVDATISSAQGVGTIINDDLVAGRLDHFVLAPVFSPQIPQRSIPVFVTAMDAFEQVLTNFAGNVPLTASPSGGATNLGLAPFVAGPFLNGTWSGPVTFTNVGTQVKLRVDDGLEHIGTSNPFDILAMFPLALTLPTSANEGDGPLVGQAQVWFPLPETNDVTIGLSTTNSSFLSIPPNVLIPAGQTSAAFTVTVLDNALLEGTRTCYVSTVSTQYSNATASMAIHDNEIGVITIAIPAQITEETPASGQVMLSATAQSMVSVALTSSYPARLQVPASVSIPLGATSATFTVTAPNNSLYDGDILVSVSGSVQNWTNGTASTLVKDNELYTFSLNFGNSATMDEDSGTRTNAAQIFLNGTTVDDLVVDLASSDVTELIVPASVTVAAGTNRAFFNLTAVDDNETDGSQNVLVTATALGFSNKAATVTIRDNDIHHFSFSAITGVRTSGVPFQITVSAADTNNLALLSYSPQFFGLRAAGTQGPFTIGLVNSGGWSRGVWTGTIFINSPFAQSVFVEALDLLGHTGRSATFNLVLPP